MKGNILNHRNAIQSAECDQFVTEILEVEAGTMSIGGASGNQHALCLALAMIVPCRANIEANTPQVQTAAEEDLTLARQVNNPWQIASSEYFSLMTGQLNGDLPDIRREVEEAIRLCARLKNNVFITGMRSELAHVLRHRGELDEARAIYIETVPVWLELGHQSAVAHEFECLAALAVARRMPERAARLLGVATALRTRLHSEMAPNERPEYEATLAGIRLQLDQATLKSAWSTGEAMGLEQAVAYALGEV